MQKSENEALFWDDYDDGKSQEILFYPRMSSELSEVSEGDDLLTSLGIFIKL